MSARSFDDNGGRNREMVRTDSVRYNCNVTNEFNELKSTCRLPIHCRDTLCTGGGESASKTIVHELGRYLKYRRTFIVDVQNITRSWSLSVTSQPWNCLGDFFLKRFFTQSPLHIPRAARDLPTKGTKTVPIPKCKTSMTMMNRSGNAHWDRILLLYIRMTPYLRGSPVHVPGVKVQ